MGQRHQLFIIAKVGTRYRVLAAVHHQWLYGLKAVEQCLQAIQLLQADVNQAHIRRELQQAVVSISWADSTRPSVCMVISSSTLTLALV